MKKLTSYQAQNVEKKINIKTVSFIPAPATMKELTRCQVKDAKNASRQSASFQRQPP
jgi:hypothetical protein